MKLKRIGLLPRVLIGIVLGILLGGVLPEWAVRVFATFQGLYGNFLVFLVPLIIVALVVPAIAMVGRGAGKLLLFVVLIAYGDTVFSGMLTLFTSANVFPSLIGNSAFETTLAIESPKPFFTIEVPPPLDVMTSLVLAFILGIGMASVGSQSLQRGFDELREIVTKTIKVAMIPLLPIYTMCIFVGMAYSGAAWRIVQAFVYIVCVIIALHVGLLLLQYCVAGIIARRSPLKLLATMMPAYFTALGTSSSAATIPVTLDRVKRMGVDAKLADFVVPLCATIHLSGSEMKITACAVAITIMQSGTIDVATFCGFVMLLGVVMVAAPGVPGGAAVASVGVLQGVLGFDSGLIALMMALYVSLDSVGTACNVTGDGAIALVVNRLHAGAPPRR